MAALADEPLPVPSATAITFSLTPFTWLSSGHSKFSIANFGGPNVASELKFSKAKSEVAGFTGELMYHDRAFLRLAGQFGKVHGGNLNDSDYLGDDRTFLFSESMSQVGSGSSTWGVTADIGARVLRWPSPVHGRSATLDVFLGWQHWEERFEATKGVQTQDPFGLIGGTGPFPNQGPAITETFRWDAARIGLRESVPLLPRLFIEGEFAWIPYTVLRLEDSHWQRSDLQQHPSVETTARGGGGYQWNLGMRVPVTEALSLTAAYQSWSLRSNQSTMRFHNADGTVDDVPFNGGFSVRQGVTFGLNLRL
ncbi:MAG TPA: hypothetical protein VFA38_02405 [Nitrospirales bacterium]|nr:hypothetical protein [Nitrospirales bacterium]